jgi:hypothetical protein
MTVEHTFTDKNRDYRTYRTICDDEGNNYSQILFHKVGWCIGDRPDITELQDNWAEEIIQAIIDDYLQGDFAVTIDLENDEEEYRWLNWKIMSVWDGWS